MVDIITNCTEKLIFADRRGGLTNRVSTTNLSTEACLFLPLFLGVSFAGVGVLLLPIVFDNGVFHSSSLSSSEIFL